MTQAAVITNEAGTPTAWVGKAGTDAFRLRVLRSAMGLVAKTGGRMQVTRGVSNAQLLKQASEATGKKFKRGQYAEAHAALVELCATTEAALVKEGKVQVQ